MRLLSIQRGTPRTEGRDAANDSMDRRFTSAIWKWPVGGPVGVGPGGLEGDAVANRRYHGGADQALLAYAAAHYPQWRKDWGSEDLGFGAFGENLTVAGADEETVCLGDCWSLGAVTLEVTAAREPCATLARRHRVADLVGVVRENGRGGWYLRVLREGKIVAGMPIDLRARPHPEWPVRRALRVMVSGGRAERRTLLSCPVIASRWRARLERMVGA